MKSTHFVLTLILLTGTLTAQDCETTTIDILGPYYVSDAPVRNMMAHPDEPGERMFISGTIKSSDCQNHLAGVMVEVWHANEDGCYSITEDCDTGNPGMDQYNLRARFFTNESGFYFYDSILPGRYGSGSIRPRHVHYQVSTYSGHSLITQLYFEGDPYIESDPWASHPDAVNRIIPLEWVNEQHEGVFDINLDTEEMNPVLGDANLDQLVDVLDAVLLVQFILGSDMPVAFQFYTADLNQDLMIDVLDIVTVVDLILSDQ